MTGRRGRFIAGAVCPKCGVMDRLVVEPGTASAGEEHVARRRCVSCGYSDEQPAASSPSPRTRLDGALKERDRDQPETVTTVRIVDPHRD